MHKTKASTIGSRRDRCAAGSSLRKKRGVWVFRTGEPLAAATVQRTIEQTRRERDGRNLAKSGLP
ncbi:MAG TPA: hypothetical protein VMV13_05000 [Candidatus Binataceae bacterium]|nr:hypothetical protein [Candidatus Binataceae bacterium]